MRASLVLLGLLTASPALAQNALELELKPKAQAGQGQPQLLVRAQAPLASVQVDLRRASGGSRIRARSGPLRPGQVFEVELKLLRPGTEQLTGTLEAKTADGGGGSMPLDLSVELLPELKLEATNVELEQRKLRIIGSRPLERVELTVISETGSVLGTGAAEASGAREVEVGWEQRKGEVLRISAKGFDADGFFGGVELYPWKVDIPHEDVVFASGEAVITEPESAKLEAARGELQSALQKYGELAEGVTLFVAGHTDTVGDAAANQVLSARRARAIARWFRSHGVKGAIRFAGFGESHLWVQTPDDADEPRNRRAEYIVAVDAPRIGGAEVAWKSL